MRKKFIKKIDDICKKNANKEFIIYFKDNGTVEKWTYKSFWTEVCQMVKQLEKGSINKGDRIVLLSQTSPEAYRMIIALAIFGATCIVLNGEQPKEEQDYLIVKSDIQVIMTNSAYYSKYVKEYYEDKYPVWNLETGEQFCQKTYSSGPTRDSDKDVLAILYSSGTTSEPKGVMISYEGQLYSSEFLLRAFGTSNIRYLLTFPLFHISGFSVFFALLLGGGQIGLLENANSTKLLEGFQKYHPNAFGMIPKVYETLQQKIIEQIKHRQFGKVMLCLISISGLVRKRLHINIGKYLFKKINTQVFGGKMIYLGVGGGLVTKEISDFFLKLGYSWMNTYASTELNLPIATTTYSDNYPTNAVGKLSRFSEISIRIQHQNEEGLGEIQVKSPCRMKGYFRDIDATKQAYEGEYFKTGDLGYIDGRGYLYVTGRSKESIHLKNGEKVSPERIEALYASCIPDNVVAACAGVLSEGKDYDEIVFFIEKKHGFNMERIKHDILEYSTKIGGDFRVSHVLLIDKIPRTAMGKVQRYKLQKYKLHDDDTGIRKEEYFDKNESDIYQKIKQIIIKNGVTVEVKPDLVLEQDLGLDSLGLFDLCVGIVNTFQADVFNCISPQITVSELCHMIEADKNMEKDIHSDFPLLRHKWDKKILLFMGKLTRLCYSFETVGLENIPKSGPYIICANHESHLDGMWIVTASEERIDLEQFCCIAKKEHLEHGISRKGLRIMGGIPVDRRGNTSSALKKAMECLQNGKIVLIHPEGTRTDNGKLGKLKVGVEKLALEAQVPILPVKIEGAYEIFPRNRKLPRILSKDGRYKLSVEFLKPLQPYNGIMKQLSYIIGDNKVESPPLNRTKMDIVKLSIIMFLSKRIRNYHINGSDNVERGKNYILCANHASYFDPIWILTALNKKIDVGNVVTLAAVERSKDSKGFFRMLGGISVNRDYGVHPEINCVENCLRQGMNAIIFPEGTRTRDGNLMKLKKGVIKIAKDTHVPILPIYIVGGFDIFPRHKKYPHIINWKKHKRFEINLVIRQPIFPDEFNEKDMFEKLEQSLKGHEL